MSKKIENYSIGLDLGTNSVGWAVIDENYNLVKLKGKDAWGAFLFEKASTAKDRRLKRGQRRRYERRRERISLLQELLSGAVYKADPNFYIKLSESSYRMGEGCYFRDNRYNLFDGDYTDRDFYNDKNSLTIYHLRNHLMTCDTKEDIRKIYLAIHHIIKYRGNFLFDGKKIEVGAVLDEQLKALFELLLNDYEIDLRYTDKLDKLKGILKDKKIFKSDKKKQILALFADSYEKDEEIKKNFVESFTNAILGYKTKLTSLLLSEEKITEEGGDKEISFSFSDSKYDESEDMYLQLAADKEPLFTAVKAVYTAILFDDVMQGEEYISRAMIAKYEKHKEDLKVLKELLRNNNYSIEVAEDKKSKSDENESDAKTNKSKKTMPVYSWFFRTNKGATYLNYVGTVNSEVRYSKKISRKELYDSVKSILEKIPDCEAKAYCIKEIDLGNFLPKLNDVANGAIPYQMNLAELEKIIDNQGRFYPELKENKEKIISLLTFKRPYYIGTFKGKHSWIDQTITERITPWNYKELVEDSGIADAAAENFILRMTNDCQYLPDEKALPKNSILYQAYSVLNELNKIRYKGNIICDEWKKDLFLNVCCTKRNVKVKDIEQRLKKQFNVSVCDGDLTGFSKDTLTSGMTTLIDFKMRLTDSFDKNKIDAYEEAIKIITIFDDEKIKENRLKELNVFNDNQIKSLAKLKYAKWGRFSRKLLHGILGKNKMTILQTMFETNKNFNEIIFDEELGFKEIVMPKKENENAGKKFSHEQVEKLYCSPSVKKSIWNALKIVEEIEKVAKRPPKRIFIESTLEDRDKKQTDSRIKKLKEYYGKIKKSEFFNSECEDVLKSYDNKDIKLTSDAVYLWLMQLGRCMYSWEPIPFEEISKCEIDHVVPRSYVVDDSFENRVLVKRIENQRKADTLAISADVQAKMTPFWKFLLDKKLIGTKKFANLTKTEYSENDRIGFINRQLVETSQTVKEVKNLLMEKYPDADIQCIRAGLNSKFRQKYAYRNRAGFFKIRELNNFHHAKDAYLIAVLGQFTTVACPMWGQSKLNSALKYYIANPDEAEDDLKTLVNKRYGYILDLMQWGRQEMFSIDEQTGEYLWDNTRYNNIFATMEKNNCLIVKKKEFLGTAEFYDQTVYGPLSGKKDLMPLKSKGGIAKPSDIYGGYSSVNPAYFVFVEERKGKNGKINCVFDKIPVYVVWREKQDKDAVEKYIKQTHGEDAKIIKKIYKYQKIVFDGQICYISGTKELNNAQELYADSKYERMLFEIEKDKKEELLKGKDKYENLIKEFIIDYCKFINEKMPLYSNFAHKLSEVLTKYFEILSYEEKTNLVKNMLQVSNTGAGRFDLDKKLGGGTFGRLNKTVTKDIILIDESCTGLYSEKKKISTGKEN